jgi:hypothetical protein
MSASQSVNAAVHLAVAKILATKTDVTDRHALGQSIGRRIQGTYGADLRRLAEADPDANAEELVAVVIALHEHALDDALARQLRDDREAGARDRVRKRNYGEPVDLNVPIPADLSERIAAIRAQMENPPAPAPTTPDREPDPEFAWHIDELRRCAEEGRRQFALDRRARLDAAKGAT